MQLAESKQIHIRLDGGCRRFRPISVVAFKYPIAHGPVLFRFCVPVFPIEHIHLGFIARIANGVKPQWLVFINMFLC